VVTFDDAGGSADEVLAVASLAFASPEPLAGAASTKAEGGSPPTVSASDAFRA
jgi:hypothetical protein